MSFLWAPTVETGGGGPNAVLDDFEDGDATNWNGHSVTTTNPLEGTYSITPDTSDTSSITVISTPRGWEYRCLFEYAGTASGTFILMTNAQSGSPDNGNTAELYPGSGEFWVDTRENGSFGPDGTDTSFTPTADTTYQLGLRASASDLEAVIYNEAGDTELASVGPIANTTHTSGTLGIVTTGTNIVCDYFAQWALP